jgi:Zn-dependent peptidase ImmA (M78 family)/transcriptional regulator with XRE-family HTH domain
VTNSDWQFYGVSLRVARAFRGYTQAELADRLEVARPVIREWELDQRQPTATLWAQLATTLDFAPEFFRQRPQEITDEECHFRRRARTTVATRNKVLAHGTLFQRVVDFLDRHVELPCVRFPELRGGSWEIVEQASETCRKQWGLTLDAPITNMTRVLENAGAVVATLEEATSAVDAFSWAGNGRPVVVRSTAKQSPSRARFDLAHECGHLVLHAGLVTGDETTESEANRFASAFLLPRQGFIREYPKGNVLQWDRLFALKRRWQVSVQAILRRAYDLQLIDSKLYRRAFMTVARKGWKTQEPFEPEFSEQPEVVHVAFDYLRNQNMSLQEIATAVELTIEQLLDLTNLSITHLDNSSLKSGDIVYLANYAHRRTKHVAKRA